jgi:DNA-binding NtrC family response regulator
MIGERRFDLIFLDLVMPLLDGAELFGRIRNVDKQVPVVIITGYPDSELLSRAMKYGPFLVMKKPFGSEDILKVVRDLTDRNIG